MPTFLPTLETGLWKILGQDHRIVLADLNQDRIDAVVKDLAALGIDA